MKGARFMRLSIDEIERQFPSQWVGLLNVEWDRQNNASILSAEVKYTGKTQSELLKLQFTSKENIVPYYTTPNDVLQLGALM